MTSRKEFLVAGALAAAAIPGIADAAAPATAPSPMPKVKFPKLNFDLAAFNALLDGPQPHKHLYTSVAIEKGAALQMVGNTMEAYGDIGIAASGVLPACVFYHSTAVLLGFDDHVWQRYVLPAAPKIATVQRFEGMVPDILDYAGKADGNPAREQIADLAKSAGLRLFLCNAATEGFSYIIAGQLELDPLEVYRDIAAHALPNAMLTPTGVWAVHAAQEHKFTLLPVNVKPA